MLSSWHDPEDPDPVVEELVTDCTSHPDYPSRRELVERWEAETGLEYAEEHDRFYRTLAVYKLAGLGEMGYRRYLDGNADDPMYPEMEQRVPTLADRAIRIVEGEEPL